MSEDTLLLVYCVAWLTVCVSGWVIVGRCDGTVDVAVRRGLLWAHDLVAAVPLLWFAALSALIARAYWRIGEWPHGDDWVSSGSGWPDFRPANIDARIFGANFELVVLVGIAVLFAWPFFLPLHHFARRLGARRSWIWIPICVAGFAAFSCILLNADPGEVMEWLDG
jgi:hypothetical protein